MKKKEFIDFVSKEKKIPKPSWKYFLKNTFIILFLTACLFLIGAEIYYMYKLGLKEASWTEFYSLILAAFFAVAILFHIKYEWNSDKHFKEVKTEFDASENFERMSKLVKTFRIQSINIDKRHGLIVFRTKPSWLSWGEKITIICENRRILLNSKCADIQLISFGQQKRNLEKLEELALKKVDLANSF